jgi:hypothetical protein
MGFSIRSPFDFRSLRMGGGPPLSVTPWAGDAPDGEAVITWQARPGNPFHGRLLRNDAGFAFWASDAGWYFVDTTSPAIAVEGGQPSLMTELRLFGVPASLCASAAGDIALHASAVAIDGKAVLFAAPSMYGKTTTAAAFAAAGHRLLAEDTARCRIAAPGVYPGPSVVRLREDVAAHITIPGAVAERMPNGRVCLLLPDDQRGDGQPIPLHAIVILRSADGVSLESVPRSTAARDLFALSFLLPIAEHREVNFTRIVDLVSRVEVVNLARPLTLGAMPKVIGAVEQLLGGSKAR